MKKIDRELFKDIVTRRKVFGESAQSIATAVGITDQAVNNCVRIFDYVKAENWELLISTISRNKGVGEGSVRNAADLCSKKIPEEVFTAFAERQKRYKEPTKAEEPMKAEETQKAEEPKQPGTPNDGFFFVKILEALHTQNELITQLMDVVMPKYACDIKDCLNVNADLLCERLKSIEAHAEKVSYNTRKRGA